MAAPDHLPLPPPPRRAQQPWARVGSVRWESGDAPPSLTTSPLAPNGAAVVLGAAVGATESVGAATAAAAATGATRPPARGLPHPWRHHQRTRPHVSCPANGGRRWWRAPAGVGGAWPRGTAGGGGRRDPPGRRWRRPPLLLYLLTYKLGEAVAATRRRRDGVSEATRVEGGIAPAPRC